MENLGIIAFFVVIIVAKVIGSIVTESNKKKERERRREMREEPESPYSVPSSTMEGPGPRRTARPQTARPVQQRTPQRISPRTARPQEERTPVRMQPTAPRQTVRRIPPTYAERQVPPRARQQTTMRRDPRRPEVRRPAVRPPRSAPAPQTVRVEAEPRQPSPTEMPFARRGKAVRLGDRRAARRGLVMHDDPIINGIIWAEILNEPRCYSRRSPIAARR